MSVIVSSPGIEEKLDTTNFRLDLIETSISDMKGYLQGIADIHNTLDSLGQQIFITNVIFTVMFGLGLIAFMYQSFFRR